MLKRSLEAGALGPAGVTLADLSQKVNADRDATVDGIYLRIIVYANEHMGQSVAYARMMGIVPPWSKGTEQDGGCNRSNPGRGARRARRKLLPGAALRVLQLGLPRLRFLAFRLADHEGAAAQILGLIELVVCQWILPILD